MNIKSVGYKCILVFIDLKQFYTLRMHYWFMLL